MTIHQQDQNDLAMRRGSRMVSLVVGDVIFAVVADVTKGLRDHLDRYTPFERAIFLLVIVRSGSRFRSATTALVSSHSQAAEGISINAIATSLNRSFETTRRHVNGLIRDEICERIPSGVILRPQFTESPVFFASLRRSHDRMVGVIDDLKLLGVPLPSAYAEQPYDPDTTLAALFDLMLVSLEYLAPSFRSWRELLIINAVANAGERNVTFDANRARRYGDFDTVLPEDQRQPVSVADLAGALGMTESSIRREVTAAIKSGNLMRVGHKGFCATTQYLISAPVASINHLHAARLATILQRLVRGGFRFDDPALCYLDGKPPRWFAL